MKTDGRFASILMWLKGLPKRHKIIAALAALYLIWLAIMTPIKNPFASDAVTVRGRFPFDQGFELMFLQEVKSTSTWSRWLCGGIVVDFSSCYGKKITFIPRKLDKQHYELIVYRDAYFSGLAGWQSSGMFYRANKSNTDLNAIKKQFIGLAPLQETLICDSSAELISQFGGGLFCTDKFRHKDYKRKVLPEESDEIKDNLKYDFWLESELNTLNFKEIKQ